MGLPTTLGEKKMKDSKLSPAAAFFTTIGIPVQTTVELGKLFYYEGCGFGSVRSLISSINVAFSGGGKHPSPSLKTLIEQGIRATHGKNTSETSDAIGKFCKRFGFTH